MQLTCPVCQAELLQTQKNLRCVNGHSFDAARQGYWNLLLAHKKRSKDPGDNPDMVRARRAFLELGHYQPLSERINRLAREYLDPSTHSRIVDMGCGEGYYSANLAADLNHNGYQHDLLGIDISKHAIKAACARSKAITWAVASGAQTPVADASLDLQLVLFSRLMPEALAKPMHANGHLIIAWPGESHLIELRKKIYANLRPSSFDPIGLLAPYFSLQQHQRVEHKFSLDSAEQIQSLLAMTPHGQRLKPEAQAALCQLDTLKLSLDVNIACLSKRADAV